MATDEVQFLRDQVQRLNSVLAEYQEKYPQLGVIKQQPVDGEEIPWLTDKSLWSPLLVEYDANLQLLRDQVEQYKHEQKVLRSQLDKLVAENKRLTQELKETVQGQLEGLAIEDLQPLLHDDQLLHNLQEQLQMALQEKDSLREMWQVAQQEIERLESQLQNQQFNPRFKSLEQQADQIKNQYTSTVDDLNREISQLQQELATTKNELRASSIQVSELRRTLEEMKKHYLRKEEERSTEKTKGEAKGSRLEEIELELQELENKLEDARKENSRVSNEKRSLEQKVMALQKKISELEQKEYEAALQVRESVQMVENAIIEKDQALVRERQTEEQVEKLQEAIGKLVDEAGARTRQEVDNVKTQCNKTINRLMEEIHTLELDNTEKDSHLARALREKKAAESELEKLYHEGMVKGSKDNMAYEDLNKRCCDAETARDEAYAKLESLQSLLKRSEIKWSQEKAQLENEVQQLRDRLEYLSGEFETVSENHLKLLQEMDDLRRKMQVLKQDRDAAQRNLSKQVSCLERDLKMKHQEYEVKLQTAEDNNRHAMIEIRQMLTSQQRMTAKWKEECQTITHKFENKVTELRGEVSKYKRQCEELTKLLKESRDKHIQMEQLMAEYGRNIKKMEDRVREAENRANLTSARISKQLAEKRNMLFESIKNGEGVPASPRSIPETLALSDLAPPSKDYK